jgi:Spy/CpxP family protein refolding chaperone
MKKIILALILSLPLAVIAQPGPGRGPGGGQGAGQGPGRDGRLKSLEIAYLTRELNITPEEAEKFWPVYNKYQEEMRTAMNNSKEDDILERQQQMLNIRKKYKNDFSKILTPERANKLYEAEGKFRDMVRKELQERRELLEKRQEKRGG